MNRNSNSTLRFTCLLVLGSVPFTAYAAETGSHRTPMSNGCEIRFEYSANLATEIDLVDPDKDQIGSLLYRKYSASHDLSAELAKQPAGGASLDLPADIVTAANELFSLGKLLESSLEFKIKTARISCSAGARTKVEQQQQADQYVRQQKIERAISFMQDADETVQRRGLTAFREVATIEEFQALPAELRSKMIERVYTEAAKAVADLGVKRHDSFDFAPMGLLYRLDDPRALDLYMATIERGDEGLQAMALRALGRMFPRPTQVLDHLAALIESNRIDRMAMDEATDAIMLIGRGKSRPYFEKFARGKDETLAQKSMKYLDMLNAQVAVDKSTKAGATN